MPFSIKGASDLSIQFPPTFRHAPCMKCISFPHLYRSCAFKQLAIFLFRETNFQSTMFLFLRTLPYMFMSCLCSDFSLLRHALKSSMLVVQLLSNCGAGGTVEVLFASSGVFVLPSFATCATGCVRGLCQGIFGTCKDFHFLYSQCFTAAPTGQAVVDYLKQFDQGTKGALSREELQEAIRGTLPRSWN